MKKSVLYMIFVILITVMTHSIILNYCLNNVYIGSNIAIGEKAYPQFANKIIGFGGVVRNNTIFPVKVKKINPIGSRGATYVATLNTIWGVSEIKHEDLIKYKYLDNKIIPPLTDYEIGFFYKFTGDYFVNPSAFEIR